LLLRKSEQNKMTRNNYNFDDVSADLGFLDANLSHDDDILMEQILENINTTPLGLVLKNIASLPEVRREKILVVRKQLTDGKYDLNKRLDIALDKVLEDLTLKQ
jgi:hypothetical protein